MIAESEAFDYLDAPILRLGGVDSPIPYNPGLEKAAVPQTPGIIEQRPQSREGQDLTHACRSHTAQGRHGHGHRQDQPSGM